MDLNSAVISKFSNGVNFPLLLGLSNNVFNLVA